METRITAQQILQAIGNFATTATIFEDDPTESTDFVRGYRAARQDLAEHLRRVGADPAAVAHVCHLAD